LWLAGVFVALVAVVALTASANCWLNVVSAPALAPWSLQHALSNGADFLMFGGFFLLWPAAVLAQWPLEERPQFFRQRSVIIAACTLAVCLPLNFLGSGRMGAARNYYFESWVVGMLLTALICFHSVHLREPSRHSFLLCPAVSLAVLAFGGLYTARVFFPLEK